MSSEYPLAELKVAHGRSLWEEVRLHGWTWKSGGAIFGLICGGISPFLGAALTAIAWVIGPEWHGLSLHRDGTVLFVLTIPLLIFGAHCLDLLEKQNEDASKPYSN